MSKMKLTSLQHLSARQASFVVEYIKDFAARRAAQASGYAPDTGYKLLEKPEIKAAIQDIIANRLEHNLVDAEWCLNEAVDNHFLARQSGNITASNTALGLIMKHTLVDAFASDKMNLNVHADKQVMEKLQRGRKRASGGDEGAVSFL